MLKKMAKMLVKAETLGNKRMKKLLIILLLLAVVFQGCIFERPWVQTIATPAPVVSTQSTTQPALQTATTTPSVITAKPSGSTPIPSEATAKPSAITPTPGQATPTFEERNSSNKITVNGSFELDKDNNTWLNVTFSITNPGNESGVYCIVYGIRENGEDLWQSNICINVIARDSGEVSFIEYYFPTSNLDYRQIEILEVAKVS
ncbi:hypothetical protein H0N96_02705 [Candidatus Micrarchaeota archaeon]|nr:hypothetical protein [Candidatus Micrarchaeota archaeon]